MEIGFGIFDHIRGDRYEESDTEKQICFILAQATQGVCLCFFDFLKNIEKTCHLFDVLVCYILKAKTHSDIVDTIKS